jgi:hypothetical protein
MRGMDQIGNNRGGINGWITRKAIYGVVTKIVWSSCREIAIEQTDRRFKTCDRLLSTVWGAPYSN